MKGRFTFIDGLRGLAAMAVVLFHALRGNHIDFVSTDVVGLVVAGEAGVVIFFVISGFVIMHSLYNYQVDLSGVWRFVVRRSIRLDPPYWVAIGLVLSFSAIANTVVPGRVGQDYTLDQAAVHLLYLQEILGYLHINPVFWTLCYEIQFYIVLALILASRSVALFVLLYLASLAWPLGLLPEIRGVFVNLIYSFLLGVGACYSWRLPRVRPWFLAYAGLVLLGAIIHSNLFALISSATALLLVSVAIAGRLGNLLDWRWLQFLGMISYSLYLTHNPITGATFRLWYMVAGRAPSSQVIGLLLSIVTCIVFAWIMHLVVERPCIALARSDAFRPRKSVAMVKNTA
jgi:peptidoglycan/LPS O-acetylase OafA/YrhL